MTRSGAALGAYGFAVYLFLYAPLLVLVADARRRRPAA